MIVAALVSCGIAFFEYMLQVLGKRIGYTVLSVKLHIPQPAGRCLNPGVGNMLAPCSS